MVPLSVFLTEKETHRRTYPIRPNSWENVSLVFNFQVARIHL